MERELCKAELYLADDHGDNKCTIKCQLTAEHEGRHEERFQRSNGGFVAIEWDLDERETVL